MMTAPTLTEEPQVPIREMEGEERDALQIVRDCADTENPYLYSLRASAYTQILFAHGLQSFSYSLLQGGMVNLEDEYDDRYSVIFNVILPVIEARKALLLSRDPRRRAIPQTADARDIEGARYAEDAMAWGAEKHRIPQLAADAADWFEKTGNFVHFVGWDPKGGREWNMDDGSSISEGDPIWRIDSMFAWTFHPHARNYEESPYAHHRCAVSRDYVFEHFPDKAHLIPDDGQFGISSDDLFEENLKNLSPTHGGMSQVSLGSGPTEQESFLELHTVYYRSTTRWPEGRMIIALGNGGDPHLLLHDGPNPYICHETGKRTLPVVVVRNITVPNRLWGEGPVLHMMPHQRIINLIRSQLYDNGEAIANPTGYYWGGSLAPDNWTNVPGNLLELIPGSNPPGFMQPPEMPNYVLQSEQAALQFLDILTRPVGPLSSQSDANIKSGVHQMIVEETKKQLLAPTVRNWEIGWDSAWKLWIDNWRTFAKIPRRVGVVGDAGLWRGAYFSGELASRNFVVQVEPYSSMPMSRTATFAEWVELIKAGAAPIQIDQNMARQFWDDIGKGHMARTYRDATADLDKARRNIQKVRQGQFVAAEPQDNADSHLAVYTNWMKTAEYENARAQDPQLQMRMSTLVDTFIAVKQKEMMAIQMQMGAVNAGGGMGNQQADNVQGAAQAAEPGNTGGDAGFPRATQGVGRAFNPMRDMPSGTA